MNNQDKSKEELNNPSSGFFNPRSGFESGFFNPRSGYESGYESGDESGDKSGDDESNDLFELFFYSSPDATLITRLSDGVMVEINNGFTKLTGFTREETI